jgi:hypothetical protein
MLKGHALALLSYAFCCHALGVCLSAPGPSPSVEPKVSMLRTRSLTLLLQHPPDDLHDLLADSVGTCGAIVAGSSTVAETEPSSALVTTIVIVWAIYELCSFELCHRPVTIWQEAEAITGQLLKHSFSHPLARALKLAACGSLD